MYERLKSMYFNFQDNAEHIDMPDTKQADNEFFELTEQLPDDTLREAYVYGATTNELQGWVYGFRYGVQLMTECLTQNGGVVE